MLAKYWKKVLLAICVIACIYNVMSKLVNRASLEANLEKANDGNTVFDFSSKKSSENTSDIIEGVVSKNEEIQNSVITNQVENETSSQENVENITEENTAENSDENDSKTFKFTDYIFNW